VYENEFVASGQMSERELQDAKDILDRMARDGGLYHFDRVRDEYVADGNGTRQALDYTAVRGGRFIVDRHGVCWRYHPRGEVMRLSDGTPITRKQTSVEMWTGQWTRLATGSNEKGEQTYEVIKSTVMIPLEATSGKPNMSKIDWAKSKKGFRHPYDSPNAPSNTQMSVIARKAGAIDPRIKAKLEELQRDGIAAALKAAPSKPVIPASVIVAAKPAEVPAAAQSIPDEPPVPVPAPKRRSNRKAASA